MAADKHMPKEQGEVETELQICAISSLGHMKSTFPSQAFSKQFSPLLEEKYGSYMVKDSVVDCKLEYLLCEALTSVVPVSSTWSWWLNSPASFLRMFSTTVFVMVATSRPGLKENHVRAIMNSNLTQIEFQTPVVDLIAYYWWFLSVCSHPHCQNKL